ncbi:MAG: gamma-glutamylcyclotransferase family protein [Alphaproteobacteria bacterium]
MEHFFFGTLRDRELLEIVLGRAVADEDMTPATLPDHALKRVVEEGYPALVPRPGGSVEGVLVRGLDAGDIARLEWFEGKEYVPAVVEVRRAGGGRAGDERAAALIQTPTDALEIADADWHFARWRGKEKARVVSLTRGHMALFGKVGIDEAIRRWDEARERLEAESGAPPSDEE